MENFDFNEVLFLFAPESVLELINYYCGVCVILNWMKTYSFCFLKYVQGNEFTLLDQTDILTSKIVSTIMIGINMMPFSMYFVIEKINLVISWIYFSLSFLSNLSCGLGLGHQGLDFYLSVHSAFLFKLSFSVCQLGNRLILSIFELLVVLKSSFDLLSSEHSLKLWLNLSYDFLRNAELSLLS